MLFAYFRQEAPPFFGGRRIYQCSIFRTNTNFYNLHEHHGFRMVGIREKLGLMEFGPVQGRWRDLAFLEQRSRVLG